MITRLVDRFGHQELLGRHFAASSRAPDVAAARQRADDGAACGLTLDHVLVGSVGRDYPRSLHEQRDQMVFGEGADYGVVV